jgi:hypothetical protein
MYILRKDDEHGITDVYVAQSEEAYRHFSYARVSMGSYDISADGMVPPVVRITLPTPYQPTSDIAYLRMHAELIECVADEAEALRTEKLAIWREQYQQYQRPTQEALI